MKSLDRKSVNNPLGYIQLKSIDMLNKNTQGAKKARPSRKYQWQRKLLKLGGLTMQLIWSVCTCALPHGLVTAASHYKFEATATVYIIKYTNCFVKNIIHSMLSSADSSRVLRYKRSGTPDITCDRSSNQDLNLHSTISKERNLLLVS